MAKGSGGGGRGGFSRSSGTFGGAPKGWSLGREPGNISYSKGDRIWRTSKDKRNLVTITYSKRKKDFYVAKEVGYSHLFANRFSNLRSALRYGESL